MINCDKLQRRETAAYSSALPTLPTMQMTGNQAVLSPGGGQQQVYTNSSQLTLRNMQRPGGANESWLRFTMQYSLLITRFSTCRR